MTRLGNALPCRTLPKLPAAITGRPGLFIMMRPGRVRLVGRQHTMQDLANRLASQLNRPVNDETALKARKYMGILMPSPPPPGGAGNLDNMFRPEGEPPPDLFHAVQAQLSLRLDSKKGPVETIVVNHMEKTPTEH